MGQIVQGDSQDEQDHVREDHDQVAEGKLYAGEEIEADLQWCQL